MIKIRKPRSVPGTAGWHPDCTATQEARLLEKLGFFNALHYGDSRSNLENGWKSA